MTADELAGYRPLMFSIAYRMTGSVGDAEDIVQDALIRAANDPHAVEAPKAYLATITTRLAIDHLRSARVRRESYVGVWLPEPLVTDPGPGPQEYAEMSDSLSLAFLLLLESLTPAERAVFLLREVFEYDYAQIAVITGKSEQNCRQLFARARRAIGDGKPKFSSTRSEAEELTALFLDVSRGGDVQQLIDRLAPDVAFFGDSGGRGEVSIPAPLYGRDRIAELMTAQVSDAIKHGLTLDAATVNGGPGALSRDPDGRLVSVIAWDVRDGLIQAIRVIANPDKLGHLGPLSGHWQDRENEDD